jgi:tetratricopeptide (TPR) repeat protein
LIAATPHGYFNRGLLLAKLAKFDEAADDFRRATACDCEFALAYLHLGNMLEKLDKLDKAEDALRKAVAARAQPDQRVRGLTVIARVRRLRPAETHYNLGQFLWKRKRLHEAEEAIRDAVTACLQVCDLNDIEVQHDLGHCLRLLGRLLAEQGKNDKAEAAYQDALAVFTQTGRLRPTAFQAAVLRLDIARTHDVLGDALAAQSKYAEATAAYQEVLPNLSELEAAGTYCRLAGVLRKQSQLPEAEQFDRKALEAYQKLEHDFPNVADCKSGLALALYNVAISLRNRRQFAEARRHMEQAIQFQRAALDTDGGRDSKYRQRLRDHYWGLTYILLEEQDHAVAAAAVENALRLFPDGWEEQVRAVPLLAGCIVLADKDAMLSPGERDKRCSTFAARVKELLGAAAQRIKAADPKTPEARQHVAQGAFKVGFYYSNLREWKLARQSFEKAVELQPTFAEAHYRLAGILYYQRAFSEAAAAFSKAIEQRPDYAEAHEGLAMAVGELAAVGRAKVEDAIAEYSKAGELYKDKKEAARLYFNLGNYLAKNRRLPVAETAFRKAIEFQPQWEEVHFNLGLALGQQDKLKEAIASLREATRIKPDYAAAWSNLGFALYMDEQPAEALKALKEAQRLLSPDDPVRPRIEDLIRKCEKLVEPDKK